LNRSDPAYRTSCFPAIYPSALLATVSIELRLVVIAIARKAFANRQCGEVYGVGKW